MFWHFDQFSSYTRFSPAFSQSCSSSLLCADSNQLRDWTNQGLALRWLLRLGEGGLKNLMWCLQVQPGPGHFMAVKKNNTMWGFKGQFPSGAEPNSLRQGRTRRTTDACLVQPNPAPLTGSVLLCSPPFFWLLEAMNG